MPIYSHSQLSTFEQCALKFKLRYIDRIHKPGEKSVEAFTGSMVHETLQKLYDDLKYEKLNPLEELIAYYRDRWKRSWNSGIKIIRDGFAEKNYQDYGEKCIRNYYERHLPFDQSFTLETELHLRFALDPEGKYKFQGFIDRLARRPDGTYEIHDYKTGGTLPGQAEVDQDCQLPLYQYGLKARWQDIEGVDLIWHYVGLDSTLFSHRTPEQIRELTQKTIQLIDRIESSTDFPPVKSLLCDWCEYRSDCPLWKHPVAISMMPLKQAEVDEGWKLVNKYVEVKSQSDHLAGKIRELRENILRFAREQQTRVLQGNGFRITISERAQPALPPHDDPAREDLKAFVRSIGKWDELSDLSPSRVTGALENEQWPQSWRDRLRKFLQPRPVSILRLSRTEDRDIQEE